MRNTAAVSWASLSLSCLALACGSGNSMAPPVEARSPGASNVELQRPQLQAEGPEAAYDAAMSDNTRASPRPSPPPMSASVGSGSNVGAGGILPNDIGRPQVQTTLTTTPPGGQTRPPLASVAIRPTGIVVCDEYLVALRACVMQMPGPQRAAMEESIRQTAGAFASGAQQPGSRQAMEDSCRQAHEQIKGSCFKR